MGFRSVMATEPRWVALRTCDVCKRDMEELHGAYARNKTFGQYWEMRTIHSDEEERNNDITICSLQCLVQWASVEGKSYPGLWLNGKSNPDNATFGTQPFFDAEGKGQWI